MAVPFQNREDAGRRLGRHLRDRLQDPLVLGLPRGGVPVARAVSEETGWDWDIWLVRKVSSERDPEFALGALAERGNVLWNEAALDALRVSDEELRDAEDRARRELRSYRERFRGSRPAPEVGNRDVVLVDDGLATGLSARAAARALRASGARSVWGAFPVSPGNLSQETRDDFTEIVLLAQPKNFHFVGAFYQDFDPVEDAAVLRDLTEAGKADTISS